MSKPKYSSEFKIMIAEAYLNGEGGFMKKHGNASYSSDFKRECAEAVVIEGFSVNEVIEKYDIPSRSVLQRWIQVYNANRELKDYKPIRQRAGRQPKPTKIIVEGAVIFH